MNIPKAIFAAGIRAAAHGSDSAESASACKGRPTFAYVCIAAAITLTGSIPGLCQQTPRARTDASASYDDAVRVVARATQPAHQWNGPRSGPPGQTSKTIAFIAEDLRNGGVLGVAHGVREGGKVLGWTIKIFDAAGTSAGRRKALASALALHPDGVVLCGADAQESRDELLQFDRLRIPIVGWHAGPRPGPIPGTPVAMNVTTDPLEVARVTAMAAVLESDGKAGVVIFTDSRFAIATAKANAMADVIRACKQCTLLEMRDVAISESSAKMPAATKELLARYAKRWTHALAINDIYFDYAAPVLTGAGMASDGLSMLSAGDGSAPAFLRIQARTFQTATVAEPLNLQGWQIVDELNRLFAGVPVSGFVAPVHLVTRDNVSFDGGVRLQYDPDNSYREIYRRIWER